MRSRTTALMGRLYYDKDRLQADSSLSMHCIHLRLLVHIAEVHSLQHLIKATSAYKQHLPYHAFSQLPMAATCI